MATENNFNRRLSISRREPVITLEKTRIRGRNYEEGAYIDRRRTRMRNAHLARLIREGVCILARDMDKKELAAIGWVYDQTSPRMKLLKLSNGNALAMKNQLEMEKLMEDEKDEDIGQERLEKVQAEETETTPIDQVVKEIYQADNENVSRETSMPTVELYKNGWYKVMLDGKDVGGKSMREVDAIAFIEKNYKVVTDE